MIAENLSEQLAEWRKLSSEQPRDAMRRSQGLPTPAGRVFEVEREMQHLRRALAEACAAVEFLMR